MEDRDGTRLFLFGAGYSARAVAKRMRPELGAITGTTRETSHATGLRSEGIRPLVYDGKGRSEAVSNALAEADLVLISIAPGETGDPVLNHFRQDLAAARPRAVVYLSTVGVYGDHGGDWVDEATPCRPVSDRSRQRVSAEAGWELFALETGIHVAIIRLAGIYGPGRGPFEKVRSGKARRIVKPDQLFNRIHADDIAAITEAAFVRGAEGIFNASDDEPAPPQDVIGHAAALLGVEPPEAIAFEEAEMSPMARSFYGENKRVRNQKIKDVLGVDLAYPTYREGLAAILQEEQPSRNGTETSDDAQEMESTGINSM
ncbi:Nucleoside-diphosphate-sugar epimerase [Faunimonas pinastri]|uniref:Nucleoside-diphosphate-sugar epimerase n=1 Tax=Faunimonas pinastri TaxID=1855383 RepID=A0A1H9HLL2_9HYPH|nr:SDR family oxidoreductase [Faunimonas pinastri]SEQ63213.1 Nucleoside-diphosphate-sugar epimerase [Faunimonas pinastri]